MANTVLLHSALVCGLIHTLAASLLRPPPLFHCVLLLGVFSSIYNHAVTSVWAVWCDRFVMCVGFVADSVYADGDWLVVRAGVTLSALLYLAGKISRNNPKKLGQFLSGRQEQDSDHFHLSSHILLTCTHLWMLVRLSGVSI